MQLINLVAARAELTLPQPLQATDINKGVLSLVSKYNSPEKILRSPKFFSDKFLRCSVVEPISSGIAHKIPICKLLIDDFDNIMHSKT